MFKCLFIIISILIISIYLTEVCRFFFDHWLNSDQCGVCIYVNCAVFLSQFVCSIVSICIYFAFLIDCTVFYVRIVYVTYFTTQVHVCVQQAPTVR